MEILIGAVVSLLTQLIKKIAKTNEYITLGLVLALSVSASGIYGILVSIGAWDKVLPILLNSAGIYSLLIRRFQK